MSVETLMAISTTLDLSLDYVIYGKIHSENEIASNTNEVTAIMNLLNNSSERKRKYALQMLKIFLIACDNMFDEDSQIDKWL